MNIHINPEYEVLLPKLPKEQYEALKISIKNEGQHYAIVVNEEGVVLDGHHRLQICHELGITPKFEERHFENKLLEKKFVICINLYRRQLSIFQRIEMGKPLIEIERELAKQRQGTRNDLIDDNIRQNFAEGKALDLVAPTLGTNPETLRQALWLIDHAPENELNKLRSNERAISNLYHATKLIEEKPSSEISELPIEENINTTIKLGDIFLLGKHRLMCGDSTHSQDVLALMNGRKANVLFTDPPYGVNYEDNKYGRAIDTHGTHIYKEFLPIAINNIEDDASIYIWFATLNAFDVLSIVVNLPIIIKNWIIWVQDCASYRQTDNYRWDFEACLFGCKKSIKFYGDTSKERNVWHIPSPRSFAAKWDDGTKMMNKPEFNLHPTLKPNELAIKAIENSSLEGEIILDLFGGSGSTLIAAEQTKRVCYMMEIEPKYCQIIINRWEAFTKQKAIKI